MTKKIYLSLLLMTASATGSESAINKTATLAHIAQEKDIIKQLAIKSIAVSNAAKAIAKRNLKDRYTSLKAQIKSLVHIIAQSEEFIDSVNQVTDFQALCIVNKSMSFDDITYEPSNYTITEKINSELAINFPELDEETEQLFNLFYVVLANTKCCQLLLKKLSLKEQQLSAELDTLQ